MKPILECESVSKSFGKMKAVNDVSFNVGSGEIFGIAGPNGAGKTTLFNIITKIPYGADSGKVLFEGREIQGLANYAIYRMGIARTFQIPNFLPEQSVLRNVTLGAIFGANLETSDAEKKAFEAMKLLGLDYKANAIASTLSLIEIKELMMASALVSNPKILMLDEPFGGLSKQEIDVIIEIVRKIRKEKGMTVVIIEHIMSALMGISDRVMLLQYGQKLCEGSPEKVSCDEKAIEAYLGV